MFFPRLLPGNRSAIDLAGLTADIPIPTLPSQNSIVSIVNDKAGSSLAFGDDMVSRRELPRDPDVDRYPSTQFDDDDGQVASCFVSQLRHLSSDNSKSSLCIDTIIVQGEKSYFRQQRKEKLARPRFNRDSSSEDASAGELNDFPSHDNRLLTV